MRSLCSLPHTILLIMSPSYYPSRTIPLALSLSHYPSRSIPLALSLSHYPSHTIPLALSLSYYPLIPTTVSPNHSVALSLSMRAFVQIQSRNHHTVSRRCTLLKCRRRGYGRTFVCARRDTQFRDSFPLR